MIDLMSGGGSAVSRSSSPPSHGSIGVAHLLSGATTTGSSSSGMIDLMSGGGSAVSRSSSPPSHGSIGVAQPSGPHPIPRSLGDIPHVPYVSSGGSTNRVVEELKRQDTLLVVCGYVMDYLETFKDHCAVCLLHHGDKSNHHSPRDNGFVNRCATAVKFLKTGNRGVCFNCAGHGHNSRECPFNVLKNGYQWIQPGSACCVRCSLPAKVGTYRYHKSGSFGAACTYAKSDVMRFCWIGLAHYPRLKDLCVHEIHDLRGIEIPSTEFQRWCVQQRSMFGGMMNVTYLFYVMARIVFRHSGAKSLGNDVSSSSSTSCCIGRKRKFNNLE
jgi:hypothetical protein